MAIERGSNEPCGVKSPHTAHTWATPGSPSVVVNCPGGMDVTHRRMLDDRETAVALLTDKPVEWLREVCKQREIAVHDSILEPRYYAILIAENAHAFTAAELGLRSEARNKIDALHEHLGALEDERRRRARLLLAEVLA